MSEKRYMRIAVSRDVYDILNKRRYGKMGKDRRKVTWDEFLLGATR